MDLRRLCLIICLLLGVLHYGNSQRTRQFTPSSTTVQILTTTEKENSWRPFKPCSEIHCNLQFGLVSSDCNTQVKCTGGSPQQTRACKENEFSFNGQCLKEGQPEECNEDFNFICPKNKDGYFPSSINPYTYWSCKNNQATREVCEVNKWFDITGNELCTNKSRTSTQLNQPLKCESDTFRPLAETGRYFYFVSPIGTASIENEGKSEIKYRCKYSFFMCPEKTVYKDDMCQSDIITIATKDPGQPGNQTIPAVTTPTSTTSKDPNAGI